MMRFGLILHAVLAFAAVLSATHLAVHTLQRTPNLRALQRFGWIAPLTLLAQAITGLAIYPPYRIHVRAADFDLRAPVVAALFDFKEHLAALSLALVIGAALASRKADLAWPTRALACTGAAFLWVATILGLYVTARHPLGMP